MSTHPLKLFLLDLELVHRDLLSKGETRSNIRVRQVYWVIAWPEAPALSSGVLCRVGNKVDCHTR